MMDDAERILKIIFGTYNSPMSIAIWRFDRIPSRKKTNNNIFSLTQPFFSTFA